MTIPSNGTPPPDFDRLSPWFNTIRQINSVIVCGSAQLVSITVYVGEDGIPVVWTEPERRRLYPRARAGGEVGSTK